MTQQRLDKTSRRRSILDAARKLAARKGFSGMTTAALAKTLGVSEPVLYRHFRSKEDLFRSLLKEIVSSLTEDLGRVVVNETDPVQKLQTMSAAYPDLAKSKAESFSLIHRALVEQKDERTRTLLRTHYESYEAMLVPVIRDGQRQNAIRKDISAPTLAWHLIHCAIGFLMTQSLETETQRRTNFDSEIADLALSGLLKAGAR